METPNAGSGTPATPAAGSANTPATPAPNSAPQSAQPVTAPAPVPAGQKYKFEFEVDGQKTSEEYDEATLKAALQKAKGADKRFQEAHDKTQKAERLFQLMKENPWKVLEHPSLWGDKTREQVEQWLWNKVRMEQMDPKEREALQNKEELERLRTEAQERQKTEQRQKFEAARAKFSQDLDVEITGALEQSGLIKSAYNYRRVANYMLAAHEQGKRITAAQAIPLVKQDLAEDLRSMFESATEDQILGLLNNDKVWENLRKADLKRVAPKAPAAPIPQGNGQVRGEDGKFQKKGKPELNIGKRTPFDY